VAHVESKGGYELFDDMGFMLLDELSMARSDHGTCGFEVDVPQFVVHHHPSIAAAFPRDSFTVANIMSPATKNSTVDKMAKR
jgi:hypothetical protein